jgi:predicted DsbA family dithiol-disulfide isomerase
MIDGDQQFVSRDISQNAGLTKKEKRMLKKQKKLAEAQKFKKAKLAKRIALWVGVFSLLSGGIFGMVRLASHSPSSPPLSLIESISESDWFLGKKDSKAVLIEYSDFQCPACRYYHPIVKDLNNEYNNSLTFAYRHFPLPQHKNAKMAAYAAEAAGKQGKFWEMHDLIFKNQSEWSSKEKNKAKDFFMKYASDLDLDMDQFKKDIISDIIKDKVDNDLKSGQRAGINSTPTFFLNGKKINNPRDYDGFKKLIEETF